jgi:predicted esterase
MQVRHVERPAADEPDGSTDETLPVSRARRPRQRREDADAAVLDRATNLGHEIDRAAVPRLRDLLASLVAA